MGRGSGTLIVALLLVANPTAFCQGSPGLKQRLVTIVKRQEEARRRLSEGLEGKASADAQKPVFDRYRAETGTNTREVLELVGACPGDPAVVDALKFVITTARAGPGDESYRALEILRAHVRDPGMGELCGRIFWFIHSPEAESLIRSVLKRHPERDDRGQACHALAVFLRLQAKMVRRIRQSPERIDEYVHARHKAATEQFVKKADPEALDEQSDALLERVVAEFADVKDCYDRRPLGAIAEGELFAARHLSVGQVAPEIEGQDHEGTNFALSESRGKVVVLTFSGNWCGPCVRMYPQERELVARLKDKPFALLSVNTDPDVETLRKSIASGEITWRCWWDGGPTGPISTRWGISSFPSIFVLDRAGVIRFKDVRGDDLDRAVASLLDER